MSEQNVTAPVEAVAIVGLAGRFPHARNLDEFWARLLAGEELVTFFSAEELLASGVSADQVNDPSYVNARAVLEDADQFDASFFGINPREAELIDPQQRLFLECAWEALENAGYDPGRYAGAIGVYAGLSLNSYLFNNLARNPDVIVAAGGYQVMLASDKDFVATRTAYKLNLRGPAVTVQTACSTSLVAVQLACQSLLNYQCDMALAGGASVSAPRVAGYLYQPGMIMSPDGHCRPFDADGRGIVAGEGVGLVVLKRLSEALADGDTIHAVIKGSAINNDGANKVGFTAPSVDGQAEVIAMAQAMADVSPDSITYIEAHGTGTELGDPIEVAALTQAFRASTDARAFCALGSVKSNMGHLDAAAGIAGLLKTVLALQHGRIPPSLHFTRPNPNIDFESSPFYVNTSSREWPISADGTPRRAGVSSFGIGGTNAHVVLEEAPRQQSVQPSARPSQLLLLSARTTGALESATDALASHLRSHAEQHLADVAHTLQTGRKVFGQRRIVVVSGDTLDAAGLLERRDPKRVADGSPSGSGGVAFLFSGQGAQYVNMTRELYHAEPLFRAEVDSCSEKLAPHLGLDLRTVLYPPAGQETAAAQALLQTALAQPALFVVEYALAKLWMACGVQPRAMLGHSIGEYVAACLAGVFSLDDALAVVAVRGRLMQGMPGGSMLAVPLAEAELHNQLGEHLSMAAVNGPRLCVVSGPAEAVDELKERLEQRGVTCRPLHTSHAFHSSMMDPILGEFEARVAQIPRHIPSSPFVSNLTGTWITTEQATDAAYWASHLRSTVRFADSLKTLFASDPGLVLLEVGPGQTLSGLARQHPDRPEGQTALASMRHAQDPASDHAFLMHALGRAWLAGVEIDWSAFHAHEKRVRVALPTYPFERERYWVEPRADAALHVTAQGASPLAMPPRRDELRSWMYQPSWRRTDRPRGGSTPVQLPDKHENWLVFCDRLGLGDRFASQLTDQGQRVIRVAPGEVFDHPEPDLYRVPPADPESYVALMGDLRSRQLEPDRVAHLWSFGRTDGGGFCAEDLGFYSLLHLAQSLGDLANSHPVHIDVIGNGVFDVTGDEPLFPGRATLLGPCRVIPQEYAQLSCRYIDVQLPDSGLDATLVDGVLAEIRSAANQPLVALRKQHRWLPSFEQLELQDDVPVPASLRERGVYLIAGGMGGIGLAIAEYLARTVHARLILTGRTSMPDRAYWDAWLAEHGPEHTVSRRILELRKLEALGAEVLVASADVGDEAEMRDVVAGARARFGAINGVVHAAGVAGGGIIPLKTRAQAELVLAPKVQGTLVLESVLDDEPLDFFVLCSSFTSLLGGAGQVDYCAANAFMDAFAHERNRRKGPTIGINWSTWQEVGMAVDTPIPAHLQHLKDENLRNGIRSAEGQEALRLILSNPLPQVVVSTQDLPALIQWYDADVVANDGTLQLADVGAVAVSLHSRPQVSSVYVAPRDDVEEQIAEAWQALLGIAEIGIHDSFFDLGGHSLLATQLLARLHRLFGVELPLRTIFEVQTIAELADRIQTIRWAADSRPDAALVGANNREEIDF
jgi:acyl transferase domain-containing protein/acyl carrier protein